MLLRLCLLLGVLIVGSHGSEHTGPLTCQDNDMFPMLPTFHIIGNVTQQTDGSIHLEPINDASGVTYYNGLYHIWHQCCQNHWDHAISKVTHSLYW